MSSGQTRLKRKQMVSDNTSFAMCIIQGIRWHYNAISIKLLNNNVNASVTVYIENFTLRKKCISYVALHWASDSRQK